jgi:hypothetical protein
VRRVVAALALRALEKQLYPYITGHEGLPILRE